MITLYHGSCLDVINELDGFDMIFADPFDNIGLKYNGFDDKMPDDEYANFLGHVMVAMVNNAPISWMSFNAKWWMEVCLQIAEWGIEDSADVRFMIQTFTFGSNRRKDFTNGYRPILRLMRSDAEPNPQAVYVESWRQKNGDKRAADGGKMPDDVWDYPRVVGNSKQRRSWSPTQLHEDIYRRAIDFSCKPGAKICDMFAGSGTMARVAGQTHDVHLIELSDETVKNIAREHECDFYCFKPECEVC